MPITPGTKVKVKETFPHKADGTPGIPGHKADLVLRGKVGTVDRNDEMYQNVVKLDNGDTGLFYDHELEII